jgi:hypothetical protein
MAHEPASSQRKQSGSGETKAPAAAFWWAISVSNASRREAGVSVRTVFCHCCSARGLDWLPARTGADRYSFQNCSKCSSPLARGFRFGGCWLLGGVRLKPSETLLQNSFAASSVGISSEIPEDERLLGSCSRGSCSPSWCPGRGTPPWGWKGFLVSSRGALSVEPSGKAPSDPLTPPSKVARYLVVKPGRSSAISQPCSRSHLIAARVRSRPIRETLERRSTDAQQPSLLPFPWRQIAHQTMTMW